MANVTELHTCFKDSRADMKGRINFGTLRIRHSVINISCLPHCDDHFFIFIKFDCGQVCNSQFSTLRSSKQLL